MLYEFLFCTLQWEVSEVSLSYIYWGWGCRLYLCDLLSSLRSKPPMLLCECINEKWAIKVLATWGVNGASLSSQVTVMQSNQHDQRYFVSIGDMGKQVRTYLQQELTIYTSYINPGIKFHQKEWSVTPDAHRWQSQGTLLIGSNLR